MAFTNDTVNTTPYGTIFLNEATLATTWPISALQGLFCVNRAARISKYWEEGGAANEKIHLQQRKDRFSADHDHYNGISE
jgi:hypothetical protein